MGLKTPLYDTHVQQGAKMVDFGGWDMPVEYPGFTPQRQGPVAGDPGKSCLFTKPFVQPVLHLGPAAKQVVIHPGKLHPDRIARRLLRQPLNRGV